MPNYGSKEKFGARAELWSVVQEKLRGRGGSSCRFGRKIGIFFFFCRQCNTGEQPALLIPSPPCRASRLPSPFASSSLSYSFPFLLPSLPVSFSVCVSRCLCRALSPSPYFSFSPSPPPSPSLSPSDFRAFCLFSLVFVTLLLFLFFFYFLSFVFLSVFLFSFPFSGFDASIGGVRRVRVRRLLQVPLRGPQLLPRAGVGRGEGEHVSYPNGAYATVRRTKMSGDGRLGLWRTAV